jgi:hypothetical protein
MGCLGLKFMTIQMQIDFLLAKFEGLPPVKGDRLHAKRVFVEINRYIDVRNGKDEMIQMIDNECHVFLD